MRSLTTLLALIFTGCLSTAQITTGSAGTPGDKTALPGVPFYPQSAVCKHETTWLEPIFTLTREDSYSEDTTKKRSVTQVKVARLSDLGQNLQLLKDLQTRLGDQPPDLMKIDQAWAKITTTGALTLQAPTQENVVLGSNSVTSAPYVDYSRPYYFNTRLPWLGSSTAKVTLNPDGTLLTTEATTENKTLDTIIGLLPINALLSARLGLGASAAPEATGLDMILAMPGPQALQVTVAVQTTFAKHTLTATTPQKTSPCTISAALPIKDRDQYEYTFSQGAEEKKAAATDDTKADEKKPREAGSKAEPAASSPSKKH